MRVILQRAKRAQVIIDKKTVGAIDNGLLLLVGVTHEDRLQDAELLANKVCNLRVFEDAAGKMNLSIRETGGKVLSISQFTLYADTKKGRRPSFTNAADPKSAEKLYHYFNQQLVELGIDVETGVFGASMEVDFVNDGPVTIILDSAEFK